MGPSDALKVMEFPVRLPALSRREFHLHWQRHHSPHVMHVTEFSQSICKYLTAHAHGAPASGVPAHFRQVTPFDGVSELWFRDVSDFIELVSNPLYPALIQPDEARFLLQDGSAAFLFAREDVCHLTDPDFAETGLTKLYLLLQHHPGVPSEAGNKDIDRLARRWLDQPTLRQRLRKMTVSHALKEGIPDGFPPPSFDAVMEFWFDSPAMLAATFADSAYFEHVRPLESDCMDIDRAHALVTQLHVVHDEFSFQPTTTQPFPFRLPD